MRKYTPRRASNARWLNGAPEYILDVLDSREHHADRYTVFFTGSLLISDGTYRGTTIQYLGLSDTPESPQGLSMWGEMSPSEVQAYRYFHSHDRIAWLDLPEHVREHVIARATEE